MHLYRTLLWLVATWMWVQATAQTNTSVPYFTVHAPASLSRVYQESQGHYVSALFGDGLNGGTVWGEVAVPPPGDNSHTLCEPVAGQLFAGKIVLIERGSCEFGMKVYHAQQAGAIGVIIYNSPGLAPIAMHGGSLASEVYIPSIMVPYAVGRALRDAVISQVTTVASFGVAPVGLGLIRGRITAADLTNCTYDTAGHGLPDWRVWALGASNDLFTTTGPDGEYMLYVDTASTEYALEFWPPILAWESCPTAPDPVLMPQPDTVWRSHAAHALVDCPQLSTQIGAPFVRRCFPNQLTVRVCNQGTIPADDAWVEVTLASPDWLPISAASRPFSTVSDGLFRFDLGQIAVGACITFNLTAELACDEVALGDVICFEAHAFPDAMCLPPAVYNQWNGATVSVEAACEQDAATFTISNTGTGPLLAPLSYTLYRDDAIAENGMFMLAAGASQVITAPDPDGSFWRLEAQQAPFHPWPDPPSDFVTSCGMQTENVYRHLIRYVIYDPIPAHDVECRYAIGAYDPNDKQGFPEGVTEQRLIPAQSRLDYLIRFQNTGTDTAFTVIVTDTLPPELAVHSVRPGLASAPYQFQLKDGHVLEFRFDQINLVDSFTNEPLSHGFVEFAVALRPDLPNGSVVRNSAAIYFDFNPPVITNTTLHRIGSPPLVSTVEPDLMNGPSEGWWYPNPASRQWGEVYASPHLPVGTSWTMYDVWGRVRAQGRLTPDRRIGLSAHRLSAGIYILRWQTAEGKEGVWRLVLE